MDLLSRGVLSSWCAQRRRDPVHLGDTCAETLISLSFREAAWGLGSRNLRLAERQPPLLIPGGTLMACFSLQGTRHCFVWDLHSLSLLSLLSIFCSPTAIFIFLKRCSFYLSLGRLLSPGSPGASQGYGLAPLIPIKAKLAIC